MYFSYEVLEEMSGWGEKKVRITRKTHIFVIVYRILFINCVKIVMMIVFILYYV